MKRLFTALVLIFMLMLLVPTFTSAESHYTSRLSASATSESVEYLNEASALISSNEKMVDPEEAMKNIQEFEAKVATGEIKPWWEDPEWQAACAAIEAYPAHALPQTTEEWNAWQTAGKFN